MESKKSRLGYEISCRDYDALYIEETWRSYNTRKRKYFDAVKKNRCKEVRFVPTRVVSRAGLLGLGSGLGQELTKISGLIQA